MVEKMQNIINLLKELPPYIGEGIVELTIVVAGGLLVGYLSSKYLYRINELHKVEGWMFEKRILIYQEIFNKLSKMTEMYIINPVVSKQLLSCR